MSVINLFHNKIKITELYFFIPLQTFNYKLLLMFYNFAFSDDDRWISSLQIGIKL